MLSIAKVSTGSAGYYAKDNYYARSADQRLIPNSAWFGEGAKAAGLQGQVDAETFASVMSGQVPSGPQLGRMVDGERVHIPGYDLTFSAPKSVSVLIEVLKDAPARAAHDAAVRAALRTVERQILQTRVFDAAAGAQWIVGDQKMVAALFRHEVSRGLDPQTHTHAVVANMAQGSDGKWRSVHSPSLFRSKMLVGAIYRGELAAGLQELGYRIERTHADGRFEISGVPKDLLRVFSTRSTDIEAALKARGEASAEAAARAALITRNSKADIAREDLQGLWRERAREAGHDTNAIRESVQPAAEQPRQDRPADILERALETLIERHSAFSREALLRAAIGLAVGHARPTEMFRVVDGALANGRLIAGAGAHAGLLTTPEAVREERATLDARRGGVADADPIASRRDVDRRLERTHLSEEQKSAAKHLLTGADRTVAVQGSTGTGKTTMLAAFAKIARARGYEPLGLAPSAAAASRLAEAAMETTTLQRFLTVHGEGADRPDLTDRVLVLDEASMASTRQMRALIETANKGNAARLALIGDVKQLDAVEAGTPFAQLQADGMPTACLTDIRRQRDADLLQAVRSLAAGRFAQAFAGISGQVVEAERSELALAAARAWLELTPAQRERAALIAPTHALRREITSHLRDALKTEGAIGGATATVDALRPVSMTAAEKRRAESYRPGQTVAFHTADRAAGIARGSHWRVDGVFPAEGHVRLTEGRKTVDWTPRARGVEVFESHSIEIAEGDVVRWTRNDPRGRFLNSDTTRIDRIGDRAFHLTGEDGRGYSVQRNDPAARHMDHGWTSTLHATQGRSADHVVAVMEAHHPHLTTQKAFYVAVSRARDGVSLITDDAGQLKDTLSSQTGEQISALEVADRGAEGAQNAAPAQTPEKEMESEASLEMDAALTMDRDMEM